MMVVQNGVSKDPGFGCDYSHSFAVRACVSALLRENGHVCELERERKSVRVCERERERERERKKERLLH